MISHSDLVYTGHELCHQYRCKKLSLALILSACSRVSSTRRGNLLWSCRSLTAWAWRLRSECSPNLGLSCIFQSISWPLIRLDTKPSWSLFRRTKRGRVSSNNSHLCRSQLHVAVEWGRKPTWIPGEKDEVLPDTRHYDLEHKRNYIIGSYITYWKRQKFVTT